MVEIPEANNVKMVGSFEAPFTFDCVERNERIFSSILLISRLSDRVDRVPIFISETMLSTISDIDPEDFLKEKFIIRGTIYSKTVDKKLKMGVKVLEIAIKEDYEYDLNFVTISGIICKEPRLSAISRDRLICDFMLSSKYNGATSYIPIVAWDFLAKRLNIYTLGDKLLLRARFQSRIFYKTNTDGGREEKEVYELVANKLKKVSRK